MRQLLLFLLLLASTLSSAQTVVAYRASTVMVNGQAVQKVFAIYSDGTRVPYSGTIPSDRPKARIGGFVKLPYAPEGVRQLNAAQFNLASKYFDPNFKLLVDYRPANLSAAQMNQLGQNLFSTFSFPTTAEFNNLPTGQRLYYMTESSLHGYLEGHNYWASSLETVENYYNSNIPTAWDFWVANIESSTVSWPGDECCPLPGYSHPVGGYSRTHYPSWSVGKNSVINLESTGEQNVSFETLAGRGEGAWTAEINARRGNRTRIMLQVAARKNPLGLWAYGSAMYQGLPDKGRAYNTSAFFASSGSTALYPADGQGFSTINGRKYKLAGNDFYADESFHLDYYYAQTFGISQQDYNDIWRDNQPGKTNYPYIWGRIKPVHVMADQVGHYQAVKYRIKNKPGLQNRPVIVMRETNYEADQAGIVEGSADRVGRVPNGMGAGCIDFGNGGSQCDDLPKIFIPPYEMYSYYATARFFFANEPKSGFYLWCAPGYYDLQNETPTTSNKHHLHTVTAIFQARADLQPYERFLSQSTMVEQPLVQNDVNGGAFEAYDAIQAYNYDNGTRGPQKAVFLLRYLAQAGGYRVVIQGGDLLQYTQEKEYRVRHTLPGMSTPSTFKIRLRGPSAQTFEFITSNADTNAEYTATFSAQTAWEKAGYAGRVGSATN